MPSAAELHAWLAVAGAVLATGATVLGLLTGIGVTRGRVARLWIDRLILAILAVVAVDLLLGAGVALLASGGRGPADPLHLVYAVVALLALPAARFEVERRGSTRIGWWVCAGGLVTLGALLRLWATGG